MLRKISLLTLVFCCIGCSLSSVKTESNIPIISWGGISAEKADTLYSLAKECGFNTHLGLYSTQEKALLSMDAAARAGVDIIINFPQIKDSTDQTIALIKEHPALMAYHIKDEPTVDDFEWLKTLQNKISSLDSNHPCYINLLPNWAWGAEEYAETIEQFASEFDLPFYSFDNYPIIEIDGEVCVRSDWYRNLEEFSAMARRHNKPFWAFALAKAHSITEPQQAVYPEPTLGQLRLQVFSNLLYGAQAIQYFNFTGIVDPVTCAKKPAFELIRQVNSEITAYSHVFAGCSVKGVWHIGDTIPSGTKGLVEMPHEKVTSISITNTSDSPESGAVVSLIEKAGKSYLAIQNRSCVSAATLDVSFNGRVTHIGLEESVRFDGNPIELSPGNISIFKL